MTWDVLSLLAAGFDAVEAFLTSPWDATKVLQSIAAIVGILSGSFGIWQALRFAEKRLANRLQEYLKRDEQRLRDARTTLLGAVTRGVPKKPNIKPVFLSDALTKAMKQLKWGPIGPAQESLMAALKLASEKEEAAGKLAEQHRRQKAAAHLLLGAIADSKKDHLAALQHFKAALDIDPDDVEALEYAGLQSLFIPDPTSALNYFTQIVAIAAQRGDLLLNARAKVLQARAHHAFAQPNYNTANQILLGVVQSLPPAMSTIERARICEFHGDVRREANYNVVASGSYVASLSLYSQAEHQSSTVDEARIAIPRVTKHIAALNQGQQPETAVAIPQLAPPQSVPPVLPPPTKPPRPS
ncbi:MAG: hypothetical protein CTY20_10180 [Hyphomicrobium sp.]|nr:MAG: hypothetical protein CTY20_10180 [Hyphomicrobium sp.]